MSYLRGCVDLSSVHTYIYTDDVIIQAQTSIRLNCIYLSLGLDPPLITNVLNYTSLRHTLVIGPRALTR